MFKEIIADGQNKLRNLEVKSRNYVFDEDLLNLNKIISFIWPRRVGKTYLMFDFIKRLIVNKKLVWEQVVFINFSSFVGERIDAHQLLQDYASLYPDLQPFFVFDEIQDIANFREFVLSLYNLHYKIFMSWSNAKLLASELSTHFRGRIYEYKIYPLDYTEILLFHNISDKDIYSAEWKGRIINIYNDIFKFWSFPELVLVSQDFTKTSILEWYFDVLFYKDLLERYNIANETALKFLIKNLTLSFTKDVNINKIYNSLKSQWSKVGKDTLYTYYDYIKNVFYGWELENFYEFVMWNKKLYLYNIWFHRLYSLQPDFWQSFENVIFLELKKKYNTVYFKRRDWWEIDFYISQKDNLYSKISLNIQVCYQLNKNNFEREILPLINVEWEKVIVYFEKELDILDEWNGIEVINFFDFIQKYC